MLVISRKSGEYLVLNDNIFIKVMKVTEGGEEGDKVKLAIAAPDEVKVVRGEIFGTREELQKQLKVVQNRKRGGHARAAEGAAI